MVTSFQISQIMKAPADAIRFEDFRHIRVPLDSISAEDDPDLGVTCPDAIDDSPGGYQVIRIGDADGDIIDVSSG